MLKVKVLLLYIAITRFHVHASLVLYNNNRNILRIRRLNDHHLSELLVQKSAQYF
jgi:hypothetical protein